MNHAIRNMLAVFAGIIIGGIVNMGLVMLGPVLIPSPEGVDLADVESLKQSAHLFTPIHYITPFLAHSLGTFCGCLMAFLLALKHKPILTYIVGGFYLLGGITAANMIPAPTWFIAADLILAYIPMAWLAIKIGNRILNLEPPANLD